MAMNSLLDIPHEARQEVREATERPALQTLLPVIDKEWPAKKSDVSEPIRLYFDIRETLGFQDGIFLEGQRILTALLILDMTACSDDHVSCCIGNWAQSTN